MTASIVNEITFYLSNQPGQLAKITHSFVDAGISISGLLVSEGFGKSVVKIVVDHDDRAMEILNGMGLDDLSQNPILAVRMKSQIGALSELSEKMSKANVNMDNIYVTESTSGDTIAYIGVKDVEEGLLVFE